MSAGTSKARRPRNKTLPVEPPPARDAVISWRRGLIVLWMVALIGLPARAGSAVGEDPYYSNGRLVGMGDGGPRILFNYHNVRFDVFRPLILGQAQDILDSMKSADGLGGQLMLDDEQRRILANVSILPSPARRLGMFASYGGGRYRIHIPDETTHFLFEMGRALIDSGGQRDLGYFNLLIMSEMDWFRQRSPRWYSPQTYSNYKGYPAPQDAEAMYTQYRGMTGVLTLTVLMHELCHHFRGHTTTGARAVAALRGRDRELRQLMLRHELEADRCAAEFAARLGIPPGFAMTASLAISIVMGDAPGSTHPPSAERIRRVRDLDEAAIPILARRQPSVMLGPNGVGPLIEELLDQLEDYHNRYN